MVYNYIYHFLFFFKFHLSKTETTLVILSSIDTIHGRSDVFYKINVQVGLQQLNEVTTHQWANALLDMQTHRHIVYKCCIINSCALAKLHKVSILSCCSKAHAIHCIKNPH